MKIFIKVISEESACFALNLQKSLHGTRKQMWMWTNSNKYVYSLLDFRD